MKQTLFLLSLLTFLLSTLAVQTQQSQQQQTQQQQAEQGHFKGTPAYECSVSFVGAGLSGVYSAWRLATAEDSTVDPTTLCVFEREETYGGLMKNVEVAGKNVEMGVSYYLKGMPFVKELLDRLGIQDKCAFMFEMKEDTVVTEVEAGAAVVEETVAEVMTVAEEKQKQQQQQGKFFNKKTRNVDAERTGEGQKQQLQQQTNFFNKGQEQQVVPEPEPVAEAEPAAAIVEECPKITTDFWFIRNKLVTRGTLVEALSLYNFDEKWEKVPNLFHLAYTTALHGKIDMNTVLELSRTEDTTARWETIAPLIDSIIFGEPITFNDIPLNKLSLRMILEDQNINSEWLQSALDLSDFSGLDMILDLSFEHVAVELLRYFSSGLTEMRKVTEPNGMKTIVDRMIEDLNNKGVRIFYKHTLSHIDSMDDGSLALKFRELEGHAVTSHLVLAISAENLKGLKHSDIFKNLTPDAAEMLGALKPIKAFEGILFYERAWWKDLGLTGVAKTDNRFEMISYLSEDGCEEVKRCGLRFVSLKDAESFDTIDLVNRIDETSVISRISGNETTRTPSEIYSLVSLQGLVDDIHRSIPGYTDMNIGLPVEAVFANWATDERMNIGSYPIPSRIRMSEWRKLALNPIPGLPVHFVNSDFSGFHQPASSLISGERVASRIFGLMRPEWISNQAEYDHLTKIE